MIEAAQFERQFNKLCAAFGTTKPEKTKDLWFGEFEGCDYFTFCQAIKNLQRGERFPNWGTVWDTYKPILPDNLRKKESRGCNDCKNGRVFYRDAHPDTGEVHDYVADCAQCTSKDRGEFAKVNPRDLHKDRIGRLRTVKALAQDRKKIEIKRPEWIYAKFPKLKDEKVYFQGLDPQDDPDVELVYQVPVQNVSNGKEKSLRTAEIAKALFGVSDPKTEARRETSLKQNAKEQEFGNVPY